MICYGILLGCDITFWSVGVHKIKGQKEQMSSEWDCVVDPCIAGGWWRYCAGKISEVAAALSTASLHSEDFWKTSLKCKDKLVHQKIFLIWPKTTDINLVYSKTVWSHETGKRANSILPWHPYASNQKQVASTPDVRSGHNSLSLTVWLNNVY